MTRRASRCARSSSPSPRRRPAAARGAPRSRRLRRPSQRERLGHRRAARADGAAGARGVADERFSLGAALGAGGHVRQVAGQPEQLELEREPERIERGSVGRMRRLIEKVEEPRQCGERPLVRLLLAEQPQHRLGADHPDREPVVVLARRRGASRTSCTRSPSGARCAPDGGRARRATAARAARRSATSSFARPSPPRRPGRAPGVEVKHPVGLSEPDRPENDGLRAVRPSGHASCSLGTAPGRNTSRGLCVVSGNAQDPDRIRRAGAASACARRRSSTPAGSRTRRSRSTTIPPSGRRCSTPRAAGRSPRSSSTGSRSAATPSSGGSTGKVDSTSSSPPEPAGTSDRTRSSGRRPACGRSASRSGRTVRRGARRRGTRSASSLRCRRAAGSRGASIPDGRGRARAPARMPRWSRRSSFRSSPDAGRSGLSRARHSASST